jgi:hypothetical protein
MRPATFAWGGNAMTHSPAGDPHGAADGFPGSLFIMGHDRMPYGELPDGNQVAEVSIPVPVQSRRVSDLKPAEFRQDFTDVARGWFTTLDEIPRVGMAYLNHPVPGPKIHLGWGAHFQDPPADVASHAWFEPTLGVSRMQGPWYIGAQSLYGVNGYLFAVPGEWAEEHLGGRYLATGRFRDGGWSGMGPALFAYRPWTDGAGTPAPPGSHLPEVTLLQYASSVASEDVTSRALRGYQHADEWEGGAWLTTASGKAAVLFVGTKGTGQKYWYGYRHPKGPQHPCVDPSFVGQFAACRHADGNPCPAGDLQGCTEPLSQRGWWSSGFTARFVLYDPAELVQVAKGVLSPWEPQPYAHLDIDEFLFLNPAGIDIDALGKGLQRRYRIGDAAYDHGNDLLYVLELFADDAKPVVHVWRVGAGGGKGGRGAMGSPPSESRRNAAGPDPTTRNDEDGSRRGRP